MDERIRKYKEEAFKRKMEREEKLKELWNNLKPFENPEDIPDLPIINEKEYQEFYVVKLIEAGAIPKKDLVDGQIYHGQHRRCRFARWNENDQEFEYWRNKFGQWFIDTCNHFQDDDGSALFVPIKLGTKDDFQPKY